MEALDEALSGWGNDDGAILVISHDQAFCEKVGFTHVATVSDGAFRLEQRSMRTNDWKVVRTTLDGDDAEDTFTPTPAKDEMDPALRKMLFNAPKRISSLESLIEKTEEAIAAIDEKMMENGSDVGLLTDLSKEKGVLEDQVAGYMEEWEELEELLLSHA